MYEVLINTVINFNNWHINVQWNTLLHGIRGGKNILDWYTPLDLISYSCTSCYDSLPTVFTQLLVLTLYWTKGISWVALLYVF